SSLLGQADEKLTQVHRELAAVQARLEALESETPPPPAMTDQDSVNVYVDRRGLVAETEDKAFRIRVRPRIQIVGNLVSDDDDGSTGFTLRRVRPVFEGNAGRVSWRFTPEFAGNVRILDAWAQVPFHGNVGLQAGKFKGPVGYERLQSFTN